MNITKELMRYHTHINPIQFHCFANKQDIELFIPEFFESFNVFGYTKNEDTYWAKKQCKTSNIFITIEILNLGIRDSDIKIKTIFGDKPDIEKEIKQIYSKIIEYSNILDETNFI